MKNFFFIILILCSGFLTRAQKPMYLYFESQNQEPFYLKIDEKVYTSVAPGYYVLSGLQEGRYKLSIGIPSESRQESRFEIDVKERDRGFLIKRQGQNLVLQDMYDGVSLSFIKDASQPEITYEPRNDAFTLLLSKASGDPGLLMSPVFASAELKQEKTGPVASVVNNESSAALAKDELSQEKPGVKLPKSEEAIVKADSLAGTDNKEDVEAGAKKVTTLKQENPVKEESIAGLPEKKARETGKDSAVTEVEKEKEEIKDVADKQVFERTNIKKFAESSTSEGFNLVYIDDAGGGEKDTIRIMIPNPRYNLVNADVKAKEDNLFLDLKEEREKKLHGNNRDSIQGKAEASPGTKMEKTPEEASLRTAPKDTSAQVQNIAGIPDRGERTKSRLPQNDCKNSANENDFFKLRKNMASRVTDEDMVAEAKKSFKSRCFDTEQIKNLSSLFLTSAGKYLFFDAAFLHVSDREQFASLENEIRDDYYKKRFKALIGE